MWNGPKLVNDTVKDSAADKAEPNDVASLPPTADIVLVGWVRWDGDEGGEKTPGTNQPGAAAAQK